MRQRGLRGLSLPARGVQAALERELSRPPAGGWFPSLPLRQRAGRFLPPLFPITRRRGRNLPADARSVRSRQEGRAARALTEDPVTITPAAEATGSWSLVACRKIRAASSSVKPRIRSAIFTRTSTRTREPGYRGL